MLSFLCVLICWTKFWPFKHFVSKYETCFDSSINGMYFAPWNRKFSKMNYIIPLIYKIRIWKRKTVLRLELEHYPAMWFRNTWCPYWLSSSRVRDMPSGYLNFSYYSCHISLTSFLEPITLLLYSFIDSHYFLVKLIFPTHHCHFPIIFLSEISCVNYHRWSGFLPGSEYFNMFPNTTSSCPLGGQEEGKW